MAFIHKKRILRALHLPTTVGAGAHGIANVLATHGITSSIWAFRKNYLQYPVDCEIFCNTNSLISREIARLAALRYVFEADCIFFNYGCTLFSPPPPSSLFHKPFAIRTLGHALRAYLLLMQSTELLLLKLLRKPYFILYQGDDIRQGTYLGRQYDHSIATVAPAGYYTEEDDLFKQKQMNRLTKDAVSIFYLNPDLAGLLPPRSTFLPYSHVVTSSITPTFSSNDSGVLHIVHAPTHREIKGSDLILSALHQLRNKGYAFTLDVVEQASHKDALLRYSKADLLIDQLYAGWYGGIALECMAMGKAVACYIRDEDCSVLPPGMLDDLPIIRIDRINIVSQLAVVLAKGKPYTSSIGFESRSFALKWHSPRSVGHLMGTSKSHQGTCLGDYSN